MHSKIADFERLPRGKCTGCDKVRVRYLYVWSSGRREFSDGKVFQEAYCKECLGVILKGKKDEGHESN